MEGGREEGGDILRAKPFLLVQRQEISTCLIKTSAKMSQCVGAYAIT